MNLKIGIKKLIELTQQQKKAAEKNLFNLTMRNYAFENDASIYTSKTKTITAKKKEIVKFISNSLKTEYKNWIELYTLEIKDLEKLFLDKTATNRELINSIEKIFISRNSSQITILKNSIFASEKLLKKIIAVKEKNTPETKEAIDKIKKIIYKDTKKRKQGIQEAKQTIKKIKELNNQKIQDD